MSLHDRDYMKRPSGHKSPAGYEPPVERSSSYEPPVPHRSWWRKIGIQRALAIALAVFAVGSAAIWFVRDLSYFTRGIGSREGLLIVNINTASNDELETLPGIGPALATLIITGRPYDKVDDLERVQGIGPSKMQSLRPLVVVDGDTRKRD